MRYFTYGEGAKSTIEFEAILAYWPSWYALSRGPKDGISPYVFPRAIRLAKGERLALAPIYLGSLFYQLDECVQNIIKSMGRSIVVSYADTSFLQLFLWERFETLGPKSQLNLKQ